MTLDAGLTREKNDEKLDKKKTRNMSYHAYFLLLIIWKKMMNKMKIKPWR